MARSKVTNLNIAATMDTQGVDEGAKKIERNFDRIERRAKRTKTTLDEFSGKLTGRFIALGAVISQTDRALNILYQSMNKAGSQGANAPWWQDPSAGGGGSQWKQFGVDTARNAVAIGIGIGLQRFGGSLLKGGWARAAKWVGGGTAAGGAVNQGGSIMEMLKDAQNKTMGRVYEFAPQRPVEVKVPEGNSVLKSGIGAGVMGALLLPTVLRQALGPALGVANGTLGGIAATGSTATGVSVGLLATLTAGVGFAVGKAISDAFGGKGYRLSEAFSTMGGWVGIGRSNASLKREARDFYAGAPALKDRIDRARAARLDVQQPVLEMVRGMMSPAVALMMQRDKVQAAVGRGMLSQDDAALIERRLMSGGGRFASGHSMPVRATHSRGELTNSDKLLMRIAERLEVGIPVKVK